MSKKNNTALNVQDQFTKNRLLLISGIGFFACYSLLCFVLAPWQTKMSLDVAYSALSVELVGFLCRIVELLPLILFFAVLAYGVCRLGISGFRSGIVLFLGASAYKYLANMAMAWKDNGSIPLEWYVHLADVGFYVLFEAIQLLVLLLIFKKLFKEKNPRETALDLVRFERIYEKSNVLMRASLLTAIVVFVSKVIGRVLSDLTVMILDGLPQNAETWKNMLFVYGVSALVALLYAAITYAGMILLLPKLAKHAENSQS